jgi:cell division septum initiation protein DivIVA
MELELTPEQISQIVRAARVLASGFTEEQLQLLIDCQKKLADSGFCEAAWVVARLEREKGVSYDDVLDACAGLQQEKERLEAEVARLEEKLQEQQDLNREAKERHRQVVKATEQTRKELTELKVEQTIQEKNLAACQRKAEEEKKRIAAELEEHRKGANVTKQEIDAAGRLKAQIGSSGFSLEEMLGLSQEFASHRDARQRLAEGLKKYHSLTGYLNALDKWAEDRKKAIESEIANLGSQQNWQQSQLRNLAENRQQLEIVIARLQGDVAAEEEMRRFYRRYYGVSGLIEYLASWEQVIFLRCSNPASAAASFFNRSVAGPRLWTDKPLSPRCPHCGLAVLVLDEKPYQALGWPVGALMRLQLGE